MTHQGAAKLDFWLRYKKESGYQEVLEKSFQDLQTSRRKWENFLTTKKNDFTSDFLRCKDMVRFRDMLTLRANTAYATSTAEIKMLERRVEVLNELCKSKAEYAILLHSYLELFAPLGQYMKKVASQLNLKMCMEVLTRHTTLLRLRQEGVDEYDTLVTQLTCLKEGDNKIKRAIAHTNLLLSNRRVQLIDELKVIENEVREWNTAISTQLKLSTTVTRTLYQAELMVNNIYHNLTSSRGKPANANTIYDKLNAIDYKLATLLQSCELLMRSKKTPPENKDKFSPRYSLPPAQSSGTTLQPVISNYQLQIRKSAGISKSRSNANTNNPTFERNTEIFDSIERQFSVAGNNAHPFLTARITNPSNVISNSTVGNKIPSYNINSTERKNALFHKRGELSNTVKQHEGVTTVQVCTRSRSNKLISIQGSTEILSRAQKGTKCITVFGSKSHTELSSSDRVRVQMTKRVGPRSVKVNRRNNNITVGSKSSIGLVTREREEVIYEENSFETFPNAPQTQTLISLPAIRVSDTTTRISNL